LLQLQIKCYLNYKIQMEIPLWRNHGNLSVKWVGSVFCFVLVQESNLPIHSFLHSPIVLIFQNSFFFFSYFEQLWKFCFWLCFCLTGEDSQKFMRNWESQLKKKESPLTLHFFQLSSKNYSPKFTFTHSKIHFMKFVFPILLNLSVTFLYCVGSDSWITRSKNLSIGSKFCTNCI
jgi:hypothetical protein